MSRRERRVHGRIEHLWRCEQNRRSLDGHNSGRGSRDGLHDGRCARVSFRDRWFRIPFCSPLFLSSLAITHLSVSFLRYAISSSILMYSLSSYSTSFVLLLPLVIDILHEEIVGGVPYVSTNHRKLDG